jgi:hypothetical protein
MKIWAILGAHRGDNNQVLALAEELGLPFECKQLKYNGWRHLGPTILGPTLRSLTPSSRAAVSGDAPDLTISTGHRSVPVVQALRRRSNGRMRSVHVGYPRISPSNFDLVVATPEYPIAEDPKVMRVALALTRRRKGIKTDEDFWTATPQPRRLLILGGPTLFWTLRWRDVAAELETLRVATRKEGGSVIAVASPRTPGNLVSQLRDCLDHIDVPAAFVPVGGPPSYAELIDRADEIAVTADSVAMISDAVASGKPVKVVKIQPTVAGRIATAITDLVRPGERMRPRDLRFFWRTLEDERLVGSTNIAVPDTNRLAAERVKALLHLGDF